MIGAGVPLARRNLFHDRRRALLSLVGIGAAFVLVIVLDGIFTGTMRQVTTYIRRSPADIFVAQADVSTMHMTSSMLDPALVERAADVEGVAWAEGLRFSSSTLDTGRASQLTYVFGYDTATGRGGPRSIKTGRAPRQGEIVVDDAAAGELGIDIGDVVTVLGGSFSVSGLSTGGTYIANTTVFVTADDFAVLRGPSYAYVLVGVEDGVATATLRQRVAAALPDTNVMTRATFAREEAKVVRSMAADIMAIMTVIGFLIALTLIALTLFTATLARQREYGVLKALGSTNGRLTLVVLGQAAWTITLAFAVAVGLSLGIAFLLERFTANLAVDVRPGMLAQAAVAAIAIGAVGATLPLNRVARTDAATAFRRA